MPRLRFHIRFPEDKIKEPVIYQIGHEYKVVTNVRRADVRETTGWMDVELTGETAEIEMKAGDVMWREPEEHAVDNIGSTEAHALLFELK